VDACRGHRFARLPGQSHRPSRILQPARGKQEGAITFCTAPLHPTEPPKATARSPREAPCPLQCPRPGEPAETSAAGHAALPTGLGAWGRNKGLHLNISRPKQQSGWQSGHKPPLCSLGHTAVPTEVTTPLRMLQRAQGVKPSVAGASQLGAAASHSKTG